MRIAILLYSKNRAQDVLQDIEKFSLGDYPIAESADGVYIINDGQDPQLLFSNP